MNCGGDHSWEWAEDPNALDCFWCDTTARIVPAASTYLVVDGRVMKATVDQQGYAGPQVHLIFTDEPWETE